MTAKIDVFLLTGFLGSGKTSLLSHLLRSTHGRKFAVIVNEFGKIGVDGKLLADEGFEVTEIDNGSIFCACKLPAFEKALEKLQDMAIDTIVVEASGLSDPTQIAGILELPQFRERLVYRGAICLIDAARFDRYIHTALVSEKQIKTSDVWVINKVDLVTDDELQRVINKLLEIRPDADYQMTTFGQIKIEILNRLANAHSEKERAVMDESFNKDKPIMQKKDLSLRKILLRIDPEQTKSELHHFVSAFASETFRIKGFVQLKDGFYYVDAVGENVMISPHNGHAVSGNEVNVLYNSSLKAKEAIVQAINSADLYRNQLI